MKYIIGIFPRVLNVLIVSICLGFVGLLEARTATYCEGPEWVFQPPEKCFEVDTSVIGGIPIENFVVKRPDLLLLDTDTRRYELSALPSETVDRYCRDEVAGVEDLPELTIENVEIVFHDRNDENGTKEANITLSQIGTSDGYAYETFHFGFFNTTATGKLDIGIGPDFEPSLSDLGLESIIWLQAFENESTGYRADNRTLEERLAFYALPAEFRRMLYAILIELPEIIARADTVSYRDDPETSAWPELNWAIESAESYLSLAFHNPIIDPPVTLDCRLYGNGNDCIGQVQMEEFRDLLGSYIADYLGTNRNSSKEYVLNGLRDWAAADALSDLVGINEPGVQEWRTRYEINFFILTALQAWSILLQDGAVTSSDRQLIESWFSRIIEFTAISKRYQDILGNVGFLERGVVMAWGILSGNHELFKDGIEKIYLGLHHMRTDGSFPREVARGDASFNYQNQITLNLLYLAELAAMQGYDPYGWSGPEGTTLHDPVTFILDALEDPTQLEEYAYMYPREGSSNNYDLPIFYETVIRPSFSGRPSQYTHGKWLIGAWTEPYMRRFPNHPNTARLKEMFFEVGLEESRPLFFPQFGGNTTCYRALPIEGFNHPVMGEVIVMGGNAPGDVLTAGTSSISDNDGLGDFSFQWYRNGEPIPLSTLQNYTLTENDLGKLINVSVSYIDPHGNDEIIFGESRLPAQPTSDSYNDLIEMYVIILGRAPAQGGLDFWSGIINEGKDFSYVASEMWNSAGARDFYPEGMTTEEVVTSVYVNILVREPKQGGLNYWVSQWEKNGPVDTMLEMIGALTANNSSDPLAIADKKLFQSKVDMGGYLANTVKNTDVDLAAEAFQYLNSGFSLEETKVYIDNQI